MAIAVAYGVSPDRGLYAAIVSGFLVSALSGSRFQIGGPAGAFIVLVFTTVARFGVDSMLPGAGVGLKLAMPGTLSRGTDIEELAYRREPLGVKDRVGLMAFNAVLIFDGRTEVHKGKPEFR